MRLLHAATLTYNLMEAVFGASKVLMWKTPRNESRVMVHLGFKLNGIYGKQQLEETIPSYCRRTFNCDVQLM